MESGVPVLVTHLRRVSVDDTETTTSTSGVRPPPVLRLRRRLVTHTEGGRDTWDVEPSRGSRPKSGVLRVHSQRVTFTPESKLHDSGPLQYFFSIHPDLGSQRTQCKRNDYGTLRISE